MDAIYAITRPHPRLLTQYVLQSMFAGPFSPFLLIILYFRYKTMEYRFDEHGVSKRYGVFFRREVNLHIGYFRGISDATRVRNLILDRLRKHRGAGLGDDTEQGQAQSTVEDVLREVRDEARALRIAASRKPT